MKRTYLYIYVYLLTSISGWSQQDTTAQKLPFAKRQMIAGCVTGIAAASSYLALGTLWYADYPKSGFHFFNDNGEWMMMDKVGHVMTSYYLGSAGYEVMHWCGMKERSSLIAGGGLGFIFLTGVELFDAHSKEWGFSLGDEIANLGGTFLFVGQQILWNEQRLKLKFSFSPSPYAKFRPDVLGENRMQQILKDYNGQTYWMSANVSSFFPKYNKIPKWLNVAVGLGAQGMTGGRDNGIYENDFNRYRQFYFSFDVDLSKIKTKNRSLNAFKNIFNFIKIPFPTVEYSVNKAWFLHPVFF